MRIIISPYAQKLPNGALNPKNFPYWPETLALIKEKLPKLEIIQIGRDGEEKIKGITGSAFNKNPVELLELSRTCDTWISVDSFYQHFCNYYKLPPGIVVYSQSNPNIFGYSHNKNLLKNKKYLKPDQFLFWWHESTTYNIDAFVDAKTVAKTLFEVLKVD